MWFVLVLLFQGSTALYTLNQGAHRKCDYAHVNRTYTCSYIENTFPKMFYGNYALDCVSCSIPTFKVETFPYENSLISMNLTNSRIRNITSFAFQRLGGLHSLDLRYNVIRNVSRDAFNGLLEVYELYLDNNELEDLTPGFLNNFEGNQVRISWNKLKSIAGKTFEGIKGVMALDLSHNHIFTLFEDSFSYLDGLEFLDMSDNALCNLPLGAFKNLKLLKTLNLAGNHFRKFHFGTFSGLNGLIELNLSRNALIQFEPNVLLTMGNLRMVDIGANDLQYVDGLMIHAYAPPLRQIGISDNVWNCISLSNLIQYLHSVNIHVNEHYRYDVTNVHGIACADDTITDQKLTFEKFYNILKRNTNNAYNYC